MARPPLLERLFAAFLTIFPSEFRGDFGDQMTADFRDQQQDAAASGTHRGIWAWRAILDLACRAPVEHLDILRRDAGYALRLMRRRPVFTTCTALTLAVGIGLNTAVFSMVSGVVLRSLPVAESERLVRLYEVKAATPDALDEVSSMNFIDWHTQARSLDALALVGSTNETFIAGDLDAEQVNATLVSPGFFEMVEARPVLGRLFNGQDYDAARAKVLAMGQGPARQRRWPVPAEVVILSHEFWERYFHARTDVIGSKVRVNDSDVEVIGVLPARFALARNPLSGELADCWLIEVPDPGVNFRRSARLLTAVGRLAPGVSLASAQAEFSLIATRLAGAYPEANAGWVVRLMPLLDTMVTGVRRELWFLFGAAVCVLLIACANIANLLVARAKGRRIEMATRVAIGASRAHLVRQVLTESLLLGGLGGVGGLLLAFWAVPAMIRFAPPGIPRLAEVAVDGSMVAFTTALSLAVGLGCGLAACFVVNPTASGLSARSSLIAGSGHRGPLRQGLTTAQVALAMLLIIAAGLLVRTMRALSAVELGFNPHGVVTAQLNPSFRKYRATAATLALHAALIDQIREQTGAVAIGTGPRPLAGGATNVIGTDPDGGGQRADFVAVSAGYFDALGATAAQGRLFRSDDGFDATHIAIVNEAAARRLFGGGPVVGRTVYVDRETLKVVGVLHDVRNRGLDAGVEPAVYVPQAQARTSVFNNLLVRTRGDPREVVPAIRAILKLIDPDQPLTRVETLDERIDDATAPRRFVLRLVGIFSLLALGLAMLGVYAVLAESVEQRVPEIGVRVALGATRRAIVSTILSQVVWMVGAGIALGVGGALALRRSMTALVFGIQTADGLTYATACVGMVLATLAACWIPASRAANVDPIVALRQE